MTQMTPILVRMSGALLAEMDKQRGDVPRAAFVRRCCEMVVSGEAERRLKEAHPPMRVDPRPTKREVDAVATALNARFEPGKPIKVKAPERFRPSNAEQQMAKARDAARERMLDDLARPMPDIPLGPPPSIPGSRLKKDKR